MIFEKLKIYAYIVKQCLRKKHRTKQLIHSEYEKGRWDRPYLKSDYDTYRTVYRHYDESGLFILNNKLVYTSFVEADKNRYDKLSEALDDYKNDEIVEIGCGPGINLFKLRERGFNKLKGYDISENALNLAKIHNSKIGSDISFDVFDLTKKLPDFSNKILFSFICLEQLKNSMKTVVQNIVDSNPKLVINFEVDYDKRPFMMRKFLDAWDYQNNLVRELNKNEDVNVLSIKEFSALSSPVNVLSTIIWKPSSHEQKE